MILSELQTSFIIPIIFILTLAIISNLLLYVLNLDYLPIFTIQIIIGLIISRWFNNYVNQNNFLSIVDSIYIAGLSLVMFLSGYEVETKVGGKTIINDLTSKSKNVKSFNAGRVSIIITILIHILAIGVSFLFVNQITGNKIMGIILLTLVFSSSFAGIIVPIIVSKEMLYTPIGKVVSTIANISEGLSILFLSIVMLVINKDVDYKLSLLLVGSLLFIYLLFKNNKIASTLKNQKGELTNTISIFILILVLFFVVLSDFAGVEYILGAFVIGMIVRSAQVNINIIHSLEKVIFGVFAPIFFILVGTKVDVISIFENVDMVILTGLLTIALVVVELPILFLLKWFNRRTVIPSMLLLSSTIIVPLALDHFNHELGLYSNEFSQALIFASLLVCIIGTIYFVIRFPFDDLKKEVREKEYESNQRNF